MGSQAHSDAHQPPRTPAEGRARTISLGVALLVAGLLIPGSTDFALDDAWIHLSYAKSLRLHEGLSYNPHDWETGVSSPLWVALLAVWPTGTAPVLPVKLLGALLHGLCAWLGAHLVLELARTRASTDRPLPLMSLALLGGVLVATSPPLVEAATSGMEIPLAAALLLATGWALGGGRPRAAAALGALAVWARPEALGWVLAAATILAVAPGEAGRRKVALAAALGAIGAMAVWSVGCLVASGHPFPNTQLIKGRGGDLSGLSYVAAHVLPWQPWLTGLTGVVLLAAALRRDVKARRGDVAALLGATVLTTIAIAVSRPLHPGTLFFEARYFAPLAALVPPCLAFGLPARPRWLGPALVLPVAVVTGLQLADVRAVARAHEQDTSTLHTQVARFVARELPPDAVVAVEGAGAIRWFAPRTMTIVDLVGNNDRIAARLHHDREAKLCHFVRRRPTHFAIPAGWARLFAPVFALEPLARFDDPAYTQVEPPHPQSVVVFAVAGVNPAFAARCGPEGSPGSTPPAERATVGAP